MGKDAEKEEEVTLIMLVHLHINIFIQKVLNALQILTENEIVRIKMQREAYKSERARIRIYCG